MRRSVAGILLVAILFFAIHATMADLTVHFLDVFGGDAVLLEENNKTMLIDAGPADSGNLSRLYLENLDISHLDSVMITSPVEDRYGALTNILNKTPSSKIYLGTWTSPGDSYQDILNKINSDQIAVTTLIPGDVIPFSEKTTIHLLNQTLSSDDNQVTPLIPLISYGKIRILLLGEKTDISDNSSAEIIRVADHGSLSGTDSAGINKIHPKIAVISTGYHAGEGPSPATLAILENAGTSILRTDLDGTITIHTDGERYSYGKKRMEPEMTISLVSVVETREPGR